MSKFQIAVISLLAFIACVVLVAIAGLFYVTTNARPAANPPAAPSPASSPTPSPTYVRFEFQGEGDKVELFQVSSNAPTFLNAVHFSERPTQLFTVNIKDASGKIVSFAIAGQGDVDSEKVLNLPPGQYYLEVHGHRWIVVISPG